MTQGLCGNIFRDGEKVQGGNRRSYRGGNGAGGVENDVQKSNINEDSGAHFVLTG